ncbi:transposase [Amycolatopsis sp. NPDC004079]|uniref:transposase n=1 Tax=Amycolatopsis sp. NPDC004079 TaxID=3154549 RepID=UPI0033AEFA0C
MVDRLFLAAERRSQLRASVDQCARHRAGGRVVRAARRGHGAGYDAINHDRIETDRLRTALARLPVPHAANGRIVLAVDVSHWLRPDAACSPERRFCHTYARGKGQAR